MSQQKNQTCAFEFYSNSSLDSLLNSKLLSNDFYSSIIESVDFQRLKQVSFLGAIDYINPDNKTNRFQHSLDVAKLALYISEKRNYSQEVTDHVVSAALLHDIGHAPLSHSMESSFFEAYGIDHHIVSSNLISKGIERTSITNILKKHVSLDLVLKLIEQKSTEEFSDIFNSKVNIDTIDGIHKSLAFVNIKSPYNKYALAKAAFIESEHDEKRVAKLDHFWSAKNFVYKKIITSGIGAVADHISKEYFSENLSRIDASYFLKKESSLIGGRKPIFKDFSKKIRKIKCLEYPSIENTNVFDITLFERDYTTQNNVNIDSQTNLNDFINERYTVKKTKTQKHIYYSVSRDKKLENTLSCKKVQYKLFG
ncbi:HD domain-containing protein [Vibrio sp. TRT 29B02]|uniref:HD domain-containing protein n=1 Tax=Vibrio sp. TRT 29B02 TaxID=3418508 RepID=UPI003CF3CD91